MPAQLELLQEYATEHKIHLVKQFKDAETAKESGRTQFGEMVRFLKKHREVKHILVEKTDRLYRNFRDYVLLEDFDLVIHLVKEHEVISKDSRSHAKFIHGIKVLMAKNYIDNLSEEVIKGMDQKAANGEWPCRPPLGYVRNIVSHLIEVDKAKAPLIERLFREYATGSYSLKQMVKFASDIGLRTSNDKPVNKAAAHRILGNTIYTGRFVYKGKRYEAKHDAIISNDLFNQVQIVLRRPEMARITKRNFAFRGLVKCHRCGCSMTPDMKMGKYTYYRCTEWKGKCKNSISEPELAERLADVIRGIHVTPEVADGLRVALIESHKDKVDFHQHAQEALDRRYKAIVSRMDRAYDDKLDGAITEKFWRSKTSEWNAELCEIEMKIKTHREANQHYFEFGNQIIELARSAHGLFLRQTNEERRKLLDFLVSKMTYADGTLCVTYRKPFNYIAEGTQTQKWRG